MDFLVIDDDRVFREATCLLIEAEGHGAESVATAAVATTRLRERGFDAVLLDLYLGGQNSFPLLGAILKLRPQLPVVMISARGSVQAAVSALRNGAADFLEKPFTREQFQAVVARLHRLGELGRRIEDLEEQVGESQPGGPTSLVTFTTPAMVAAMDVLKRAAKTPTSVLLLGESGTGKTMAARTIHAASDRAGRAFVTVSCPALTKELLESQLFGHVRGAFTGAIRDSWGKVRAAEGGTLFLDEIGDLPLEIQAKLLRLLQEREYERVGETVTRRADVRIVAATNRDLKQRVADGLFREDLFYRLNVIAVRLPPLRDCARDLPQFAAHYLAYFAARCGRPVHAFSPEAEQLLRAYTWPGNLRELQNAIERSVILADSDVIEVADLPSEIRRPVAAVDGSGDLPIGAMISLDRLEELHIRRVLENCVTLAEATAVLGIDQATLYRKRKKLGLGSANEPPLAPLAAVRSA